MVTSSVADHHHHSPHPPPPAFLAFDIMGDEIWQMHWLIIY